MARRNHDWGIFIGALTTLIINISLFILLFLYSSKDSYLSTRPLGLAFIFGISVYQLIYVIPVIFWLKRQQRWGTMKGVIIAAVMTALLTGPCFVMFLISK